MVSNVSQTNKMITVRCLRIYRTLCECVVCFYKTVALNGAITCFATKIICLFGMNAAASFSGLYKKIGVAVDSNPYFRNHL